MQINKNNYEEYFLLYADNELSSDDRMMVEKFAEQHPDLLEELNILNQTKLPLEAVAFADKNNLFRTVLTSLVNENNYEEYFLLYIDGELDTEQKSNVEEFIKLNPAKNTAFSTLQKAKLPADEVVVFKYKEDLYRTDKKVARIIPMSWIRIAAAASVLLMGIVVWTNINDDEAPSETNNPTAQVLEHTHTKEQDNKRATPNNPSTTQPQDITEENNNPVVAAKEDVEQPAINDKAKKKEEGIIKEGRIAEKEVKHIELPDEVKSTEIPVAISTIKSQTLPEVQTPIEKINTNAVAAKTTSAVKPVLLDESAFNGQDKSQLQNEKKNNENVVFLDTDNTEKKPKGKLRGLLRKASRLVDHVTNAGEENDQSVVRVASFEIAKK